jgi:hypothetical protein
MKKILSMKYWQEILYKMRKSWNCIDENILKFIWIILNVKIKTYFIVNLKKVSKANHKNIQLIS